MATAIHEISFSFYSWRIYTNILLHYLLFDRVLLINMM